MHLTVTRAETARAPAGDVGVPQGASHLEECRVAGYPAVRLVLRREAPCEPIVRPANFPA